MWFGCVSSDSGALGELNGTLTEAAAHLAEYFPMSYCQDSYMSPMNNKNFR